MKLEDLVPPLELCRLIPAGEFENTAFIWDKTTTIGFWDGADKDGNHIGGFGKIPQKKYRLRQNYSERCRKHIKEQDIELDIYPAPTLQEILEELPKDDAENDLTMNHSLHEKFGGYHIFYRGSLKLHCFDKNAVAAALKLWLKMKGIENGE